MPDGRTEPAADARKVVIVLAAGLEPGPASNVAACIAAGLSASDPGWAGRSLVDSAGLRSVASSHLPIVMLRADAERMRSLLLQLAEGRRDEAGTVSLFPAYAQAIHDWSAYWARHAEVVHAEEPMLGVGLVGPRRWVNRLGGSLPLWR
jgi:hypothetical protein